MAYSKRELEHMVGSPLAIDASGRARRVATPPELEPKAVKPPGLIAVQRGMVRYRGSWRPWLEKDEQEQCIRLYLGLGFTVSVLSQPQRVLATPGVADLFVRHRERRLLLWHEVKSPVSPEAWSPAQQAFRADCIPGLEHYVLGSENNARAFLRDQRFDIPLLP